ncbi:unnamed protein product, partial [Meganyctiphanes norvegica]
MGGSRPFWGGGSDTAQEGNWVWLSGKPFHDQFPWADSEPNNGVWDGGDDGEEDCLKVNWNGGYSDAPCTVKHRYICDKGCLRIPSGITNLIREGGGGSILPAANHIV